ncbi:unnamed protein product [Toxocara canis]|uniref:Uncharacterized protein n=1 Tax=Toxocara canis TaxID=6265 RepID=A0A183VEA2_TOXCA|nr:unnamed protein product [Toxocara canis]
MRRTYHVIVAVRCCPRRDHFLRLPSAINSIFFAVSASVSRMKIAPEYPREKVAGHNGVYTDMIECPLSEAICEFHQVIGAA